MPNWCENRLTLECQTVEQAVELEAAFNNDGLCNAIIPIPDSDPDWYHKRCAAWGIKWDFRPDECSPSWRDGATLHLAFFSPWHPPLALYNALAVRGFGVEAHWLEPNMNFSGSLVDGHKIEGELWNYDAIPKSVIEGFGEDHIRAYLTEYFYIRRAPADFHTKGFIQIPRDEWPETFQSVVDDALRPTDLDEWYDYPIDEMLGDYEIEQDESLFYIAEQEGDWDSDGDVYLNVSLWKWQQP